MSWVIARSPGQPGSSVGASIPALTVGWPCSSEPTAGPRSVRGLWPGARRARPGARGTRACPTAAGGGASSPAGGGAGSAASAAMRAHDADSGLGSGWDRRQSHHGRGQRGGRDHRIDQRGHVGCGVRNRDCASERDQCHLDGTQRPWCHNGDRNAATGSRRAGHRANARGAAGATHAEERGSAGLRGRLGGLGICCGRRHLAAGCVVLADRGAGGAGRGGGDGRLLHRWVAWCAASAWALASRQRRQRRNSRHDRYRTTRVEPPFAAGRFDWPIPQRYRRTGTGGQGYLFGNVAHHRQIMQLDGTERTAKESVHNTRTP